MLSMSILEKVTEFLETLVFSTPFSTDFQHWTKLWTKKLNFYPALNKHWQCIIFAFCHCELSPRHWFFTPLMESLIEEQPVWDETQDSALPDAPWFFCMQSRTHCLNCCNSWAFPALFPPPWPLLPPPWRPPPLPPTAALPWPPTTTSPVQLKNSIKS